MWVQTKEEQSKETMKSPTGQKVVFLKEDSVMHKTMSRASANRPIDKGIPIEKDERLKMQRPERSFTSGSDDEVEKLKPFG